MDSFGMFLGSVVEKVCEVKAGFQQVYNSSNQD
jgi:hypothetical protein